MPEDLELEVLAHVLGLIAMIEELFATHNAIAGGLVTDSETIMNASAETSKLLETMLIGHREMLKDVEGIDFTADMLHYVYKKD